MPAALTGQPKGRTPKLTAEIRDQIVNALRAGNYIEAACSYAGITTQTYWQWIAKADQPGPRISLYADFRDAANKARADAEIRNVAIIQKVAQDGRTWQASAWWLERSFPTRWGKMQRTQVELSGPNGQAIQVTDPRNTLLSILGYDTAAVADPLEPLGDDTLPEPDSVPPDEHE